MEGSKKLIASTKDIGLPFQNKTFGSCTKLRSSCTPNVTDWQDFYKNVTLSNGGKILAEKSKATCAFGGSPCITITDHAQQASVTQAHFDNIHPAALTFLNPMLPAANLRIKEPPKIKNIKLTGADTTNVVHSKNNTETMVKVLKAAINESLLFEVEAFLNDSKCDKTKTGWRFIKAHSFEGETEEFALSGKNFKVSFDAIGKYRIVAFGSENDAAEIQRCLDVEVVANTITDVEVLDDKNHSRKDNQGTLFLRRGVPVRLTAHYLFSPVSDADRQKVAGRLTDGMGNEITVSDTDTISFTPSNTACTYLLEFTMKAPREGGNDTIIKKTLKSHANGVVEVTCEQGELIRPGTTMVFKAAQLTYSTIIDSDPFELEAIKWFLNGKQVGTGGTITLNGNEYFTKPAIYVVEANVARPNGYKHNSPGIHEKDDWIFTVALNEITSLEGPTEWIVGKQYNILAAAKMNYEALLDGPVTWLPKVNNNPWSTFNNPQLGANQTNNGNHVNLSPSDNINSLYYETVYATNIGKLLITAALKGNKEPVKLNVTVNYPTITQWCFSYFNKEVQREGSTIFTTYAHAIIQGLSNEKVAVSIWEHKIIYNTFGSDSFEMKLLKTEHMNLLNGELFMKIPDTDPIWTKLKYNRNNFCQIFFTIKQAGAMEEIKFAAAAIKSFAASDSLIGQIYPVTNNKDIGVYLRLTNKVQIVDACFADAEYKKLYKIIGYGDTVKGLIKTTGLKAGTKIKVALLENLKNDSTHLSDPVANHAGEIAVDKDGTVAVVFITTKGKLGEHDKYIKGLSGGIPRTFYIACYQAETELLFPKDVGDDDITNNAAAYFNVAKKTADILHLPNPENFATTIAASYVKRNYFLQLKVADSSAQNEILRGIAPVVLGGALEEEEKKGGNCEGKYCIKVGSPNSELIREINIRLSGFGGNVPTDEFTLRSEKMVKQFQRDYMKVTETGKVCGNVLKAIDDFQNSFVVNFDDIKCRCGECKGFGNGRHNNEKQNEKIAEQYRKYEYPGIHRSLIWALRAFMFYTSGKEKALGFAVKCISSGYRCEENNKQHKRSSTNHMGKALDLHFNKNGKRTQTLKDIEEIREKILMLYAHIQIRWKENNLFSVEPSQKKYPTEFIAPTWIHFDVRQFQLIYLEDKYFAKNLEQANGKNIFKMGNELYPNICNCISNERTHPNPGSIILKNQQNCFTEDDGKIALKVIYDKYGKEMAIIIERMYRDETANFKSKQYSCCGTGGMEVFGESPYYGWDSVFFDNYPEYMPMGIWSAFENIGLSGRGGNVQVTNKKKTFVIFPSVIGGMEYKVFYIKKHHNNYARWHSMDSNTQENYRTYLEKIKPKFVNEFFK